MKLRAPDTVQLVKAFGPQIFYDEFCKTHGLYVDDSYHIVDEDEAPDCDTEEIPTIRCPVCRILVDPNKWNEHISDTENFGGH